MVVRPKQVKGLAQDLGWNRQEAESRNLQRERKRKAQAEREEETDDQTGRAATSVAAGWHLLLPTLPASPTKAHSLGRWGCRAWIKAV